MLNDYLEADYLQAWRTFVARTHKSHPFNDLWDECCQQCYGAKRTLQIDTPTRWSSTVTMLAKAVTIKQAVERMYHITQQAEHLEHHVCFDFRLILLNYFRLTPKEFVPNWGPPGSEMWVLADKLVELFSPTAEAITLLEGEKYVTQSLILLQLCYLEKVVLATKSKCMFVCLFVKHIPSNLS
jgi:hypothetical protein